MTVTLVGLGDQRFFIGSRDVPLGCHLAHEPQPSDPVNQCHPYSQCARIRIRRSEWVGMATMSYQYRQGSRHNLGGGGGGCYFIPPAKYVDFYLADAYEPTASGNNLATDSHQAPQWSGWLGCASPQNKPIGLAEYGLNGNATGGGNAATTGLAMAADNTYLQGQPDNLPVVLWEYWYNDKSAHWTFDVNGSPDGSQAIAQWQANETANGGG